GRVVGGHPLGKALAGAGLAELVAIPHAHEEAPAAAGIAAAIATAEPRDREGALGAQPVAAALASGAGGLGFGVGVGEVARARGGLVDLLDERLDGVGQGAEFFAFHGGRRLSL